MSLFTFKFLCICFIVLILSVAPNLLFQGYASSETVTHKIGTSHFNFVVAGDFSCNKEDKKTVNNMATKKPEIVMTVGDHSYRKSADCWFDTVSPYSFDYQNVHFLAMATPKNMVIPYMSNSAQYNFVKNDLKSAYENKNIYWIVVSSYRPLYSSNSTHPGKGELQDLYHPLFDKYGVDLVLQGHNHNYQRTYPLGYNIADSHRPIILDKNASVYNSELNGPIFATVGTAGEILHDFTNQQPFVKTQFLRHGFLNLEVTNHGSNMTGTFYDNNGLINEDQFIILKKDTLDNKLYLSPGYENQDDLSNKR